MDDDRILTQVHGARRSLRVGSLRPSWAEGAMKVERLDHLVLTVTDVQATVDFYAKVCGMSHVTFGEEKRHALSFGQQKINLHVWGSDIEPRAALSTPGSADLCFVVDSTPDQIVARLGELSVPVVEGPVQRAGAQGPIASVYVRDPDGNLVELACYHQEKSTESDNGDHVNPAK